MAVPAVCIALPNLDSRIRDGLPVAIEQASSEIAHLPLRTLRSTLDLHQVVIPIQRQLVGIERSGGLSRCRHGCRCRQRRCRETCSYRMDESSSVHRHFVPPVKAAPRRDESLYYQHLRVATAPKTPGINRETTSTMSWFC
jgi:hypothetical protein